MLRYHHLSIIFSLFFMLLIRFASSGQNSDRKSNPYVFQYPIRYGLQEIVQRMTPGEPSVRTISESWFSQKLDHFDAFNNKTWAQRYFTNDDFFNKKTRDGPVFLLIGDSYSIDNGFIGGGMWIEWAKKYSALCFQIEHRYYGKSYPTPDVSIKNLKYLSSQQALADLANFISTQTTALNLTKNKWIVFGGGYSGSLAAWFRLKYPHLAYGAVASSAPLVAKMNFKEYYEVVSNSLKTSKQGSKCTDAIQQGVTALAKMTQSKATCSTITKLFNLCSPLNCTDGLQVSNVFQLMATGLFGGNVQYSDRLYSNTPNISTLCNIMTNSSIGPPVNRLVVINNIMMKLNQMDCIYNDYYGNKEYYSTAIFWNETAVSDGNRQWYYQTCTEFGLMQTSDSTNQPFGNGFPLKFVTRQQCNDIFGPNFNSQLVEKAVNWTNIQYGGLDLVLNRTVFVSGSIDPWSALGMTTNKNGNLAIFIKGTSNLADMYPTSSNDSPALKAAKLQIEAILKSWIYKN